MKKIILVLVAMNCMSFNCTKSGSPGIPACIQERINQIQRQPVWTPRAEITEYSYNGQTVYLVSANCCDQYNSLIDANCNSICAPGGGITGSGDGKCKDFSEKATLIKLVWKDARPG